MAGYTRQDSTNQIANGNVIDAEYLDAEFDGVAAGFNSSTGHSHDGSTGEGAPIEVTGPVQDFVHSASGITPKSSNTYDLGSPSNPYKDIHIAGVAYLADIDLDNLDGTVIGATTPAAITGTTVTATAGFVGDVTGNLTGDVTGNLTGDVTGDVTGNADTATALETTRTFNITGDVTATDQNFDGTGNVTLTAVVGDDSHNHTLSTVTDAGTIASQNANSVTVTGGTINGTAIGGTTPAAGAFTSLSYGGTELTATAAELNYTDGVTSNIQTQLDNKQGLDATLTALAGTLTVANKVPYATATDTAGELDFVDEDDMASDSATAVPSQQSVKAYVDAEVGSISVDVGAGTAALSAGDIGTYVFAYASSDKAFGDTVAGSDLRPTSAARSIDSQNLNFTLLSGSTLTGTWRCMGRFDYSYIWGEYGASAAYGATLWLRIA